MTEGMRPLELLSQEVSWGLEEWVSNTRVNTPCLPPEPCSAKGAVPCSMSKAFRLRIS